jgi:DmsE family decaheme c-type cytochrome
MRIKRVIAIAGLLVTGWLSPALAATEAEPTGAAFCVTCHDSEDLTDNSRSSHGFVTDKRAPDCISCHGASTAHTYNPAKLTPQPKSDINFGKTFGKVSTNTTDARNRSCQNCHDKDQKRTLWSGSSHENAGITCDTCHQVHANKDKTLNKKAQAETCYKCHKEQRTQLSKPSHHPIPEGKMTCSDCHNVHGSTGPKLVKRDSINDTCFTCHAEKRGPFIHPHDPVAEDCSTCHNSHGTTVASLLKVRAPLLCQQCHSTASHPGSTLGIAPNVLPLTMNAAGMWQGRSCMNCHTQVHGSNNPSSTVFTPKTLMR